MNLTLRVLVAVALLLLSAHGWGAGAVTPIVLPTPVSADEAGLQDITYLLLYGGVTVLFLMLIIWAIWHAKDGNNKPATIVFSALFLVSISITLFFGGTSVYSFNPALLPTYTYDWQVYGQNQLSLTHFPSQQFGYEHQRGWALAGAVYFFRIMRFGFESLLIPLILFCGCLYAVWLSHRSHSHRPVVAHLLAMCFIFPMMIVPSVKLAAPGDDNAMFALVASSATVDGGKAPEQALLTPFMAVAWSMCIELSEHLGEVISFGDHTPGTVVAQAGLDARLADGDYIRYQEYASYCMTAVKNAMAKRPAIQGETPYADWYTALMGNAGDATPGGAVQNYARAPQHMKYALSPYADALFKDVWINEWIPNSTRDAHAPKFSGTEFVSGTPKPYTYHPNPFIGSGQLSKVSDYEGKNPISGMSGVMGNSMASSSETILSRFQYITPTMGAFSQLEQYTVGPSLTYVPYCSLTNLHGYYASLRDLGGATTWPTNFAHLNDVEREKFRPFPVGDALRGAIANRYLGDAAIDFCKGVSPDRENEHLWGCLIAGRYNIAPTTDRERTMLEYQKAFDTILRPLITNEVMIAYNAVGLEAGGATNRIPGARIYYTSGVYALAGTETNLETVRDFNDLYFSAPGIQAQIGLTGDYRASSTDEKTNSDSWFTSWIQSLVGFLKPGIAGLFAALGNIMSKICLMIYPHVIGVMTFLMMLAAAPYCVRSGLPGQYFIMLSWASGVVVICLMQLCIQVGLSFIETGNGIALPAFFIRASAGNEFGETLLRLVGSFFILSAYSVATAFMTFGMGGIGALLANANRAGFQLTGAGVAGTVTLAGMVASLGLKGGALMTLGSQITGSKPNLSGGGGPGGGLLGGGSAPAGAPNGGIPGPGLGGSPAGGSAVPRLGNSHPGNAPAPGLPGYSQRTNVRTRDQATNDAPHEDQRSNTVAHMLDHSSTAVASGAGAIVQAFTAGSSMADSSGGLAQGAQGGAAVAGKVVDAGASTSIAIGHGVAAGARALRNKYKNKRTDQGQLPDSIKPDDADAEGFARVGNTHEYDAAESKAAGNITAEQASAVLAGNAYRDAGQLAENPARAGENFFAAAKNFRRGRDFGQAKLDLDRAEAKFQTVSRSSDQPLEKGQALLGLAEVRAEREALSLDQHTVNGERMPSETVLAKQQQDMRDYADSAQAELKRAIDPTVATAVADGTPATWTAYAAPLLGRVRAATISDRVGGLGPRAVVNIAGRELSAAALSGDQKAAAVLGAVQAAGGFDREARVAFRDAGLDLTPDDYSALQADLRAGRYSALEALLRKKG